MSDEALKRRRVDAEGAPSDDSAVSREMVATIVSIMPQEQQESLLTEM